MICVVDIRVAQFGNLRILFSGNMMPAQFHSSASGAKCWHYDMNSIIVRHWSMQSDILMIRKELSCLCMMLYIKNLNITRYNNHVTVPQSGFKRPMHLMLALRSFIVILFFLFVCLKGGKRVRDVLFICNNGSL